jgi:hypothetical protein
LRCKNKDKPQKRTGVSGINCAKMKARVKGNQSVNRIDRFNVKQEG